MAQLIKVPVTKPDNLNLVPRIHIREEEPTPAKLSHDLHTGHSTCTHAQKLNK